jgi:hypothetical protein
MHSRTSGPRSVECEGVTHACKLLLKATLWIAPTRRVPGSTSSSSTLCRCLPRSATWLSFLGDDPDKRWQSQVKGMCIWSLAPQNESAHGEAIERHQHMIDYEDTADNHRPGDRANSAKLTKPDPNMPTDRMSLFKWVDHTSILLTIFFRPECPLVKEFKILAKLLQPGRTQIISITTHRSTGQP